MVEGFWPVLLVGLLGGLIAEVIRVAGAFREKKPPEGAEYIASALFAALGAGAVLYGWDKKLAIEVATLGAAFPVLFAAAVRAAKPPENTGALRDPEAGRPIGEYIAGRF